MMKFSLLLIAAVLQTGTPKDEFVLPEDQATLSYSISQVKKPYQAVLSSGEGGSALEISGPNNVSITLGVHQYSVFVVRDNKLYFADFHYMSSGCQVKGYDLKSGKRLWETQLKGLGPIAHSKYYNRVFMRFEGKDLVIYSKESAGRYREAVDPKTGKTVRSTVFENKQAGWNWPLGEDTLAYSVSQVKKPYSATTRTVRGATLLEISTNGKVVLSEYARDYTTFVVRDDKLFVPRYSPFAAGCAVESFDLKTGKSLWKTPLKGIRIGGHSGYSNRVKILFEDGVLTVYGNETGGRYREQLDVKSGKTVSHQTFM
jgi:hypothetical protein